MSKGRFDNVDLGSDKTMQRMIAQAKRERVAIITELSQYLHDQGHELSANLLQDMAMKELKEAGL